MTTQIKIPHADDVAAGANLRRIRTLRRISQETLADQLGITFQQVQKYEKGTNRISISRALAICRVLGCTITDLIAGIDEGGTAALQLPALSRQATLLAEYFDRIEDDRQRRHILGLVGALAHAQTVVEGTGRIELSAIDLLYGNPSSKEAAE